MLRFSFRETRFYVVRATPPPPGDSVGHHTVTSQGQRAAAFPPPRDSDGEPWRRKAES